MNYLTMGTRVTRLFYGGDLPFKGIRSGEIVGGISGSNGEHTYDVLWDDDKSFIDHGYAYDQLKREIPTFQQAVA